MPVESFSAGTVIPLSEVKDVHSDPQALFQLRTGRGRCQHLQKVWRPGPSALGDSSGEYCRGRHDRDAGKSIQGGPG